MCPIISTISGGLRETGFVAAPQPPGHCDVEAAKIECAVFKDFGRHEYVDMGEPAFELRPQDFRVTLQS